MRNVTAVILAAGESKRMRSEVSKLLHRLSYRYLVEFSVQACVEAKVGRIIVVVGHQAKKVKKVLGNQCEYVHQEKRLGTGDALKQATHLLSHLKGELLVLPGDAPFVIPSVLKDLVTYHRKKEPAATVLTAVFSDPGHYGRIIRNGYQLVKRIVESRNATEEELRIKEINSGIYCFNPQKVLPLLPLLQPNNISGEIYLTDVFEFLHQQGEQVEAFTAKDPRIALGINTPEEMEEACQLFNFPHTDQPPI